MTVFAVMTAGLFPLIHLGRVWVVYWILPYPNQRNLWPNFQSPLVFDVITPRLAEQMQQYLRIGTSNAGKISMPVLIQHGSADTSFSGQRELLDGIAARDKTFMLYEGLRHEVYNELPADRARVLSDLHAWLDNHLNS